MEIEKDKGCDSMRLPNEWILEFDRYKQNSVRNNENLYDSLDLVQMAAIKKYFRWVTRNKAKWLLKNTRLEKNPEKAKKLSNIMGEADDWVYDGCVDTGRLGGSHCELGHALRYEHYAYSAELNKSIVFGVSCASDFFGIDKAVLNKIQALQSETVEEIKKIVFILETGKKDEYFNTCYPLLYDVIAVLGKEAAELGDAERPIFGNDFDKIMGEFLRVGLPLTETMVKQYEKIRDGVYREKVRDANVISMMLERIQDNPERKSFVQGITTDTPFYTKDSLRYICEMCNFIDYVTESDIFNMAVNVDRAYKKIKKIGIKDVVEFSKSGKRTELRVKAANGERLATKREIETMSSSVYTVNEYPIGEEKNSLMKVLVWAVNGDIKQLKSVFGSKIEKETPNTILKTTEKKVDQLVEWVLGEGFISDVQILAKSHRNKVEYPDTAEDEELGKITARDMADLILGEAAKNRSWAQSNQYIKIAIDIATKVKKKNIKPSEKQMNILLTVYNQLTKGSLGIDSETHKSTVKKAEYIKENTKLVKNLTLLKDLKFAEKVAETVIKQGRASEKQTNIIDKAYEQILDYLDKNKSTQIFIDDDTTETNSSMKYKEQESKKDNSSAGYDESVFIEGQWEQDLNNAKDFNYTEGANDSVFEEDVIGNIYKNMRDEDEPNDMQDWENQEYNMAGETASSIGKLPSLVEMSDALGHGEFSLNKGEKQDAEQ